MSEDQAASALSDQDYDAIKAAVMETERGRRFLDEFAKQHRVAETQTLLDAIARLEDSLTTHKRAPIDLGHDLDDLAQAISATSDDICSVRNDMVEDGCELSDRHQVFASLSSDAAEISNALISTAEALQAAVTGMREAAGQDVHVNAIDENVGKLFENSWRHDVLAQRITKAMRLLTHLQVSLEAFGAAPDMPDTADADHTDTDSKQYFAGDEELFEDEPADTADMAAEDQTDDDNAKAEDAAEAAMLEVVDISDAAAIEPEPVSGTEAPEAEATTPQDQEDISEDLQSEEPSSEPMAENEPEVVVVRAGVSQPDDNDDDQALAGQSDETETRDGESATDEQAGDDDASAAGEPQDIPVHAETNDETTAPHTEECDLQVDDREAGADRTENNSDPEVEAASEIFEAFGDFAPAAPTTHREVEQPEMSITDAEKQRIVVIRKGASEEKNIPFADYLGLDEPSEANKSQ